MSLSGVVFRWLKTKYWGVGFASELPPEFIITNHAEYRMKKRLAYPHKHQLPKLMLEAWHKGTEPPQDFDPDKANKPNHFHKFIYKYHSGYVWIWGVNFTKRIPVGQKYLLTIYNWKDRDGTGQAEKMV